MQKNKILITGATGFIGKVLVESLVDSDSLIVAPSRRSIKNLPRNIIMPALTDISLLPDRLDLFYDCNVVVHIAAKAHAAGEPLSVFRQVNTIATLRLAKSCAAAGIKRFIFLSSIGVNGNSSFNPFNSLDIPAPVEDYALSKLEAEVGLKQISDETGMELIIIRPPLVYGPQAPGNFGKLMQLAKKNIPVPLGAIFNKRSFVGIDNLVSLIISCIDHPRAANQTFVVSDDCDVSTTELLKIMIRAAGKEPMLIPLPVSWLRLVGRLTGKQAIIERLCGNLEVDISHTKNTLGWEPLISVEEGIRRCFVKEEESCSVF